MPMWLRNLTFNLLKKHYESKEPDISQEVKKIKEIAKPDIPQASPSYKTFNKKS